jgi:hypothetical protein
MRSVTLVASLAAQCSSMLVGALHWTGAGGPVSVTIFGPPSADTGTDGATVVGLELDAVVVVDAGPGRFGVLLLQALSTGSAAIIAIEPSRSRRTQRS